MFKFKSLTSNDGIIDYRSWFIIIILILQIISLSKCNCNNTIARFSGNYSGGSLADIAAHLEQTPCWLCYSILNVCPLVGYILLLVIMHSAWDTPTKFQQLLRSLMHSYSMIMSITRKANYNTSLWVRERQTNCLGWMWQP